MIPSINIATNFSYLTALYPLSLVVTASGRIFSISCAITPTSCPSWPWIVFLSSSVNGFQSNVTPFTLDNLSNGEEIFSIFSFNLSSEDW